MEDWLQVVMVMSMVLYREEEYGGIFMKMNILEKKLRCVLPLF